MNRRTFHPMNHQRRAAAAVLPVESPRSLWRWWPLILLFSAFLFLSQFTDVRSASSGGTIPPPPGQLTELIGPIDEMVSDSEWIVAGVPVHLSEETRIAERAGPAQVGSWVRVQGEGDGNGGLNALRVKVISPRLFVGVRGLLTELTQNTVVVDGIVLGRTITTRVVGNPVAGQHRVDVRAAIQTDGQLLALLVVKKAAPGGHDDDDDKEERDTDDLTKLVGQVLSQTSAAQAGSELNVSGIPVRITEETEVDEDVGPILVGSWVKVKGTVQDGVLVAEEIETIESKHHTVLEGNLDSLGDTEIVVAGFSLIRTNQTEIKGNPEPGDRVQVKAELNDQEMLVALAVKAVGKEKDDEDDQPGNIFRFTGRISSIPDDYYGPWTIGDYTVEVVPDVTEVEEHKGDAEVGAYVKVEALVEPDGSLTALEIAVLKDKGKGGKHGKDLVHFDGEIEAMADGQWTVDGRTVHIGPETRIKPHDAEPQVGDQVKVLGYEREDGSVDARDIHIKKGKKGKDDD